MTCSQCAYHQSSSCLVSRQPIDLNGQICQHFKSLSQIIECDNCHHNTVDCVIFQVPNGDIKYLCPKCAAASGTCDLCEGRFSCEFETSPIDLPKIVTKQEQRRGGFFVTQVRNPDRINETCKKNCHCWSEEENYCLKENGTCKNYTLHLN